MSKLKVGDKVVPRSKSEGIPLTQSAWLKAKQSHLVVAAIDLKGVIYCDLPGCADSREMYLEKDLVPFEETIPKPDLHDPEGAFMCDACGRRKPCYVKVWSFRPPNRCLYRAERDSITNWRQVVDGKRITVGAETAIQKYYTYPKQTE